MKKVLTTGAGIDQVEIIKVLRKRGCFVIAIDQDINAPGKFVADKWLNTYTKTNLHNKNGRSK